MSSGRAMLGTVINPIPSGYIPEFINLYEYGYSYRTCGQCINARQKRLYVSMADLVYMKGAQREVLQRKGRNAS